MTRMERRRRRRRILRIKLATTAAVLAMTTASIVALTGGAAETVPEPTPQPPALQAEPVLLVAEHDSTYQPVQMTAEPVQEPEPVEEEDENEKIEAALLEQGYLHEEIPLDFDLQCHLITVCEEYGVPQSVALGVIQAESSFTATAANGSCYGYKLLSPAVHFDFKNITFSFLPHQVKDMDALVKNLESSAPEIIGVAPYEQCKQFIEALARYQKFSDIRNVGAAIHSMIESVTEKMDEVGFKDDEEWTYLTKIFGSNAIPAESAATITKAIKKAEKDGAITSKNRWQLIEMLATEYLAGK